MFLKIHEAWFILTDSIAPRFYQKISVIYITRFAFYIPVDTGR